MNEEQIKRFWSKVNIGEANECWEWARGRFPRGYGAMWTGERSQQTHRLAWEIANGPIPPGLCVLHRCDNPPCCNPRHLWLGTHADNMADMATKGRWRYGGKGFAKGEKNCNARLTSGGVLEIRRLYKAGGITQEELGRKYGVCQQHINDIINRKRWRDI